MQTKMEINDSKKRHLKIGTWNVRRGLVKRENEITNLLLTEELDVLFLTETDTKSTKSKGTVLSRKQAVKTVK